MKALQKPLPVSTTKFVVYAFRLPPLFSLHIQLYSPQTAA